MLITFWIVFAILVAMTIGQLIYVWLYRRRLRRNSNDPVVDNFRPKVAILLCVRGQDPTLIDCLTGLSIQTYVDYEIHVVADDGNDPALAVVKDFFTDPQYSDRLPVFHVLDQHPKTCSLKCAALIHAIEQLEDSVEVVALIDADVVADPNWLTDLIRPLKDPQVGASTGNRWFATRDKGIGSLVRQAWNAGALPQMMLYNIPWGGTLAIKRTTIEACRLLEAWGQAFCEDTLMPNRLRSENLKIVRVPDLIVANQESTTWQRTLDWISRQLLTVRLHHPTWPLVVAHGMLTGFCLVIPPVFGVVLIVVGWPVQGAILLGSFAIFQLIAIGLFDWIRNGNEKVIFARGAPRPETRIGLWSVFARVLATQFTYFVATVKTIRMRQVDWRGIAYSISGKSVQMKQYLPYRQVDEPEPVSVDSSIN